MYSFLYLLNINSKLDYYLDAAQRPNNFSFSFSFEAVKDLEGIKQFGLRLRQIRESKSMSQQALADEADIAKTTLQRIELAKIVTNLSIILILAKALDISPEDFFKKEL